MNELQIIIEMAKEHFEKNQNDTEFAIIKGVLPSRFDMGMTKVAELCNQLADNCSFITNARGKLIIDKNGLESWLQVRRDRKTEAELSEKSRALNQTYELQKKKIEEYTKLIGLLEQGIEENNKTIESLETKKTALDEETNKLPDQISFLKAEITKKAAEFEPLKQEQIKLLEEFLKLKEGFENNYDRTNRFVKFYKKDKIRQIETLMKEVWKDWHGLLEK